MPFSIPSSGHRTVTIWTHKLRVSHLVAYKHLGPQPPGDKVCLAHIDGNKTNNSADNLAWPNHTSVTKASPVACLKPVYGLAASGAPGDGGVKHDNIQRQWQGHSQCRVLLDLHGAGCLAEYV